MSKVLIINTPGLSNRGGMAALIGALKNLSDNLPEAQVTVLCHNLDEWDTLADICRKYKADIARHPWYKGKTSRLATLLYSGVPACWTVVSCVLNRPARKIGIKFKGIIQTSKLILDLNIDSLNDNYGVFYPVWALSNLLLGKMAGKTVVVWSSGVGQFNHRFTRLAAKFVLNKMDMIIVRETDSKEYLTRIDVNRPEIYATADHAFYMDPASKERISEILVKEGLNNRERPLIGISASQLIPRYAFPNIQTQEEKYKKYIEVMANVLDYLINKIDANIILIPHTISTYRNDRIISEKIKDVVLNKDRVSILVKDYMADELKGIIGECDLFIGARLHATIAATSMGIPTIAIVYGQKSFGIMGEMMGQKAYVVAIEKFDPEHVLSELKSRIDSIWENRIAINIELNSRVKTAREKTLLNTSLLKSFLKVR
jgi:colanic acid/amylovoran biosynthesis protein